jgi:hypothetical protein
MIKNTKVYTFDDPDDFIFETPHAEIANDKLTLKYLKPDDAIFYCSWEEVGTLNGTWGAGSMVPLGTYGDVKRSAAEKFGDSGLWLAGNDNSYIDYNAVDNASQALSKGTVEFWVMPNYDGSPTAPQWFFLLYRTSSVNNRIHIYNGSGKIVVAIYDKDGNLVINEQVTWSAVKNQWYHFSLNWSNFKGKACFYINGVRQFNLTFATQRDSDVDIIRIGTSVAATEVSNFTMDELVIYKEMQRQGEVSFDVPTEQITQTSISKDVQKISVKDIFKQDYLFTCDALKNDNLPNAWIKAFYRVNGQAFYYNKTTGQIAPSSETLGQANTLEEFQQYLCNRTYDPQNTQLVILLVSYDGETSPDLTSVTFEYSYTMPDYLLEYCEIEQDITHMNNGSKKNIEVNVTLINPEGTYKDTILAGNKKIYRSSGGKLKFDLLRTSDMGAGAYYEIKWKAIDGTEYTLEKTITANLFGSSLLGLPGT